MNTPLKVTVITVCLNAAATIERTVTSVIKQDYQNLEYIVIDGDSSDGTLNILKQYPDAVDILISEKDRGIFHAMNKALALSTGDIIYFLNADDYFYKSNVLTECAKVFNQNPAVGIIYSKICLINDPVRLLPYQPYNKEYRHHYEPYLWAPAHQGVFARKGVFNQLGGFNEDYTLLGDYDWFLRAWHNKVKMQFWDNLTAYYNAQGISYRTSRLSLPQRVRIIFKNGSTLIGLLFLVYVFFKFLKLIYYKFIHLFKQKTAAAL